MQGINPPTPAQLLAAGQVPLMKLEIYVDAAWVNLCALDGKNYVEGINVSLGGAGMTPKPVGGTCDVVLSNEDSIFHPQHPTSAYKDYLKTGRKVRVSIGAKYNDTAYYWQRVIGFIDEPRFEALAQKVGISGADFMKLLEDTELKSPDNYWGTYQTFNSIASDGSVDPELYNEVDAMDINNEAHNVDDWTPNTCTFYSSADEGGGSAYVGKVKTSDDYCYVENLSIFTPEAGQEYMFSFKYIKACSLIPNSTMEVKIIQNGQELFASQHLKDLSWTKKEIYFTAITTDVIGIKIIFWDASEYPTQVKFEVDQFLIKKFTPYYERYYELPEASKGPYRVLLKQNSVWEDVWQGEEDEGWYHEESTRRVFFDINKEVAAGTDNLKIYYFTAEAPENAVARILYFAGLYVSEAAALADMEYTAYGSNIDRIWFEAGSTCLNAIKKLCERCDYRFHFKWDGTPVFKPKPTPETTAFTFTDQKHIAAFSNYQDKNEIKNRIVIEGMKQAEPVNKEETMPPELKGEVHNQTSIDTYGERTLSIKNHLFQDQTSIDAMCAKLLAEYKDPKWYSDVEVPFNPVPLEMGDKMGWKERLSAVLEVAQTGVIRDIKIDNFNTTYKCEVD